MQPRISFSMHNLSAYGFDRMRWWWELKTDRRLYSGYRSLGGYDHARRRCAELHGYCVTCKRLYRECERGGRRFAQRRHGHTDDPVRSSRWAAAD